MWPNQSASLTDLRIALSLLSIGLALPLYALGGSIVGWALLPFIIGVIWALYLALTVNLRRAATISDVLKLWPDLITVEHTNHRGEVTAWQANPYWVKTKLHSNAKIENYITLAGNGREIQIGAFLSPDERGDLYEHILSAIGRMK